MSKYLSSSVIMKPGPGNATGEAVAKAAAKGAARDAGPDIVDRHLDDWIREFPDMDVATEGLVERILKLSRYFERSLGETARAFGLTHQDWDLLSALRRVGPPYRLSPGKLADDLMLSSGAMTAR